MSTIPALTISSLLCVSTGVAANQMIPTYMGMALSGVAIGVPLLRYACGALQNQRVPVRALNAATREPRRPSRLSR